jgi:hypothetical protein
MHCEHNDKLSNNEDDVQEDQFQKIVEWFSQKNIKPGNPEIISHSFSCKQRESLKS